MSKKPTILVVEDNESEEMLTRRAIQNSELRCEVVVARDGAEACDWLFHPDTTRPALVLLDLRLPKIDGFEVLRRVRKTASTKQIPVVVVSTSDDPRDIEACYDLCANSYVQKTFDIQAYETRLKVLLYYWFGVNHHAN